MLRQPTGGVAPQQNTAHNNNYNSNSKTITSTSPYNSHLPIRLCLFLVRDWVDLEFF